MFDRLIDEYDRRYGIDCDHLIDIAKVNYTNGKKNPNSQTRNWDFQAEHYTDNEEFNPSIEGRIRRMDCANTQLNRGCN